MTAILSSLTKLVILFFIFKLYILILFNNEWFINHIWLIVVVFSVIIATFGGFYQTNLKRFWDIVQLHI